MTVEQSAVAILAPVDAGTISELAFDSDAFGADLATLAECADRIDGRVAIATHGGGSIHGFIAARGPGSDNPLYAVASAIELVAFEVAEGHRRSGVFTRMFEALFRHDLEYRIIFVVADPAARWRSESARDFRDRLSVTLGSVGFVPLPTNDPDLHPSLDATLFVRVGRGVATPDVEDFFKRLRMSPYASVALSLKPGLMRTLLREDLERCGFNVQSVSRGGPMERADVLVTDNDGTPGRLLTVKLNDALEVHRVDGTLWYPMSQLDKLGALLRSELAGAKSDA